MCGSHADAGDLITSPAKLHAPNRSLAVADHAIARIASVDSGLFIALEASHLEPGHIHTLWMVAVSNPNTYSTAPCSYADALLNINDALGKPAVIGDVIAYETVSDRFAHFQPFGRLTIGRFGTGMGGLASGEIHLFVTDHGPIQTGGPSTLSRLRDACCTDEQVLSFPQSADLQDLPACEVVQHSAFLAARSPH